MKRSANDLKQRLNSIVAAATLWTGTAALALFSTGCFAPFIPLALDGVGMIGKAIGVGAQAGTMVKHGDDQNPEETEVMDETKFDDSDFDSTSSKNPANTAKCNELIMITPAIIEFHTDHTGTTQWRELGLGGSADSPHWTVLTEMPGASANAKDVAPGGWAPANNIDHMDFKPPLKTSSMPGYTSFLAYAPDVPLAGVERDELASLTLDFGPVLGTFKYNGRAFRYSMRDRLPCFPVPE
jgi:hypothetical protein